MLTFMNSKLPDDWQISDKQCHMFQKSKSYEILNTDIYIGEDLEFIIHVSYCCIQFDHKIYIKCKKKPSNLTKVISSYNICSGIKSKKAKKTFVIQYQKLLILFRIPLFYFIKSLSTIQFHVCFQQINQMKASKTQKHLKERPHPPKKAFKEKRN